MSSKIIRVYDRSRTVADWACPRKRYWQYEYEGRGVVPSTMGIELYLGTVLHDGLAGIARSYRDNLGLTIDEIARTAFCQVHEALYQDEDNGNFAAEQGTLVEGLLRGCYKHVWPNLISRYPKVVFIEEEMEYQHDGLVFMSKPDLVLANDEETVYVEWKSTSSKKDEWINSWNTAVQLHSTIKAVEATHGVKIDQVIVQGLYKGYKSYGRLNSPFTYGFRKGGQPPFTDSQWNYEWKSGWERVPVWEMQGGSREWVAGMNSELLADQFPQTPPILIKEDLVEAFFQQRGIRENEIALACELIEASDEPSKKLMLGAAFPQKWDACSPAWGRGCEFKMLCHGGIEDPLTAGYSVRESHHELERKQWEEEDRLAKIEEQEETRVS